MTALQQTPESNIPAATPDAHRDLAAAQRVRTTPVAWLGRPDLSRREWEQAGLKLGGVSRSTSWWVGDWVRFGQRRYRGDSYRYASRVTGYDEKTLRNYAYVANRYDQSRRRHTLTWSHHAELAKLDPIDQEHWLNEAQARKLTVAALRETLRHAQQAATDNGEGITATGASEPVLVCPGCGVPLTLNGRALKFVPISGQTHEQEH